jgi:hypothetical protein
MGPVREGRWESTSRLRLVVSPKKSSCRQKGRRGTESSNGWTTAELLSECSSGGVGMRLRRPGTFDTQ